MQNPIYFFSNSRCELLVYVSRLFSLTLPPGCKIQSDHVWCCTNSCLFLWACLPHSFTQPSRYLHFYILISPHNHWNNGQVFHGYKIFTMFLSFIFYFPLHLWITTLHWFLLGCWMLDYINACNSPKVIGYGHHIGVVSQSLSKIYI